MEDYSNKFKLLINLILFYFKFFMLLYKYNSIRHIYRKNKRFKSC